MKREHLPLIGGSSRLRRTSSSSVCTEASLVLNLLDQRGNPLLLRALTTTLAPLSANRRAVSRQMPLEAPINTTTCSSIGFNCIAFPFRLRACRGRLVTLSVAEEIA